MPNNPKVAIVVLNWNGQQDTLECLASIEKIDYPHFEVIVIDNGSDDDSVLSILQTYPDTIVHETHKNLGYAGGNNRGIEIALERGNDMVLLLNNDTVVDPKILKAFTASMQQNPNLGILGAQIFLYKEKDTFDHLGGRWNSKKGVFDLIACREKKEEVKTKQAIDYACGAALFVKKEVFEKIGLLEERFFLIWEEADFCFRAKRAGFEVSICDEAAIWHKVSASFVGGKAHTTYFWWRNRLFWMERNLPFTALLSIYFRVIFKELFHIAKLACVRRLQLAFSFNSSKKAERLQRFTQYKAALCGAKDYAFRRFGNGPAWIFRRQK